MLAGSPKARLGTAIHGLLEDVERRRVNPHDAAELKQAWIGRVSAEEQRMSQHPLEREFVPLRKSVRDFEVMRLKTFRLARTLCPDLPGGESTAEALPRTNGGAVQTELSLRAGGGLVAGRLDYVKPVEGGEVIGDHKTGSILEQAAEGQEDEDRVKDAYTTQLRLYAALYHSAFGRWPVRLELQTLDGRITEIPFEPGQALALLDEAVDLIQKVNQRVDLVNAGSEPFWSLANPSPEGCRYCAYRPCCSAYRTARAESPESWDFHDVCGTVIRVDLGRRGDAAVEIQSEFGPSPALVSGMDPTLSRNAVLRVLRPGDRVGIYSLRRDAQGALRGTDFTAIVGPTQEPLLANEVPCPEYLSSLSSPAAGS